MRGRDLELRGQIDPLKKSRAAIGDLAVKENRKLTSDERERFVQLGDEITRLDQDRAINSCAIGRAEEVIRSEPTGDPQLDGDAEASRQAEARAGIVTVPPSSTPSGRGRATGAKYAQMFGSVSTLDGWGSSSEFLHCVSHGLHDQRLRAESQQGGESELGGFALPTQLWGDMLDSALENEVVRPRATVFPMSTRELKVPSFDDLDRSGGTIANLDAKVEGETDTAWLQVARLRSVNLQARKHPLFVEASNELLADASTFAENLIRLMARTLSFDLDEQFLFGDGAPGALGALVSPAAIAINREVASEISYTDVTTMFSRLTPGSVSRSVWVAAPSTIPQLTQMSVAVGTGGSHVPVMLSNNGEFTILTRPVIFSEKAKALGTKSDLSLADFQSYAIGIRREASLDRSAHIGFAKDTETFRLHARVAGQPLISTPITPLNGSTLSPFVTLDVPS